MSSERPQDVSFKDNIKPITVVLFSVLLTKPANIGLGKGVLNKSWRRLQGNIFLSSQMSSRRLQDIIERCLFDDVLKTSWKRRLGRFLEDVLKKYSRCLEDVFGRRIANTSWRHLGKQEMFAGKCVVWNTISCCIFFQLQWTSSKHSEKRSWGWRPWCVPKTLILNISYKCVFIALFSISFHQMLAWNTKVLAALWFYIFGETSQRRFTNVPKDFRRTTFSGRH